MKVHQTPRLAQPHRVIGPHKEGEIIYSRSDTGTDSPLAVELTTLEKFDFSDVGISQSNSADQIVRARVPAHMTTAEALKLLRDDPNIEYAEPNLVYSIPEGERNTEVDSHHESLERQPNDLDRRLWNLNNTGRRNGTKGADINATQAWETTTGSRENGPLIAVIDTGIDYKHPELSENMWMNPGEIIGDGIDNDGNGIIDDVHGYNAVENSGDPMDDHSHGSHCAGTIAAVGNNGRGIVGVNWEAQLMAIKIFDSRGKTSLDTILRGLQYAKTMGVDITNNSWGDFRPSEALKDAFGSMKNTVHFAAAGNNRNNNDHRNHFPAGHELGNMVGVAATDRNDRMPTFSNFGKKTVDIAAPGDQILSTVVNGGYGVYSGTSMAAPHAAGVAALILNEFPHAPPEEVRDRLMYNSDAVPALSRTSRSGGRINAARSLEIDQQKPASPGDFHVVKANSESIELSWTTTGDDGWCGGAPSDVELWTSTVPITLDNLKDAVKLEIDKPEATGEVRTYRHPTGHSASARDMHFAFRFVDNVGHRSELKTAQAHIPAAKEVYRSEFGPNDGFLGEDDWARIQDQNGNWLWTDSPDGNYKSNQNSSLLSPTISLKKKSQCRLSLTSRHDLWKLDKALVEVTSDGESWTSLGTYHGRKRALTERHFDLADFDGKDIRIRVRLKSDVRHNRDGIYLDSIRIVADEQPNDSNG